MTLPVSTTSSTAAQAYRAICAATNSATGNASQAGAANTAFAADPLSGTASASTLNASLLNALLGVNGTVPPNSATTAPDTTSAHRQHGISAYIAQLASTTAG